MTEAARLPVEPGEILAGKYRVTRILGTGAMGVVVAAHHVQLDDEVAIKFMLPGNLPTAQAIERFAREARAAVKIKSEHVVRVHDVGTLENGAPYIVMEYLNGKDLADWLAERKVVPIEQAVDFLLQAAEAIAEAHSLGIVHRDLKPANLFITQRSEGGQQVKVLDFGISKLTGKITGSSMTQTSVVMGSPFYMSPEQLRSTRDVDHRSDIWALGVILYELVAGGPPFEGDTMPELVHRTVYEPPRPLREVRPDAPPGLEEVILKCLEKDVSARFQSVAAFAAALVPFGPERSRLDLKRISGFSQLTAATMPSSPALAPGPASSEASARSINGTKTQTAASWTNPEPGAKSRKTMGIVAAGIALVGAVAWLARRDSDAPRAESSVSLPSATSPEQTQLPSAAPVTPSTQGAAEPSPSTPVVASPATTEPSPGSARTKHPRRPPGPVRPAVSASAAPAPVPSAPPTAVPSVPKQPSMDDLIDDRK